MTGFHRFRLGELAAVALVDNARTMPSGRLFPRVPSTELAAAGVPPEVAVGYNCLYLDSGKRRVLIDTGSGEGALLANLRAAGVEPTDIDTVVITHGDGDHVGGIEAFAAARFVLTPRAWELWHDAERRERLVEEFVALFRHERTAAELARQAQQRAAFGRKVLPSLRERVDLVEPEREFLPGFRLVAAPGHRSDHTAVEVESRDEVLLHLVDGIRHPVQLRRPEWTSYIDSYPQQTAETNRRLLERAANRGALVFGAHLPFPGLGRVRADGGGWRWEAASE